MPLRRRRPRPAQRHRTWPERLTIATTFGGGALLRVAAALVGGYRRPPTQRRRPADPARSPAAGAGRSWRRRRRRRRRRPRPRGATTAAATTSTRRRAGAGDDRGSPPTPAGHDERRRRDRRRRHRRRPPTATFPPADPEAQNFLITGADNGACVDPELAVRRRLRRPRADMGERSDTIMVLARRPVDRPRRRAVVPPRPLRRDRRRRQRVADQLGVRARRPAAADRHDLRELRRRDRPLHPGRLLRLQDARRRRRRRDGAVRVPGARHPHRAQRPARPGASRSTASTALAYVRSRHYEYEDPPGSGNWQQDPSDLGRISRQQDFLRRALSSVLDKGPLNPRVARGLIRAATEVRRHRPRPHARQDDASSPA